MATRLKIAADGSLRIPRETLEEVGWKSGSYVEVTGDGGRLRIESVEVDLFAEAAKAPSPDAFEKILEKQERSRKEAFRTFEERIQDPAAPEARPEDRPDHWR